MSANRRLRVRRARFSALIPRDIQHALQHLVAPDEKQSDAVRARSEIDLRLGAAFTRMQVAPGRCGALDPCLARQLPHVAHPHVQSFGAHQLICLGVLRADARAPESI
jgi:DNA topoisomerase IA